MEANWQRQWAEHDAANPPNEKDGQQSLLIQKLMRLAVEVFEHRRYLGTVEMSWMFGIYQESATIWIDEAGAGGGPDPLLDDTSNAAKTLRQLIARMEARAKRWDDPFFAEKPSRDTRLGATGTIGFNIFGIVGWQVSVTCSIYASTLRRYAASRSRWPLVESLERYRPFFLAIAADGYVDGAALRRALRRAGAAAAGRAAATLRDAWHLADHDNDGKLDLEEYVLFIHLVTMALRPAAPGNPPRRARPGAADAAARAADAAACLRGSGPADAAGAAIAASGGGGVVTGGGPGSPRAAASALHVCNILCINASQSAASL
ncbi:hypothetical protein JL722_12606 [Aureococcus anophagefferens]|nr:hypothetical protein JL722_12606 [Aureococcus anophagefferens]